MSGLAVPVPSDMPTSLEVRKCRAGLFWQPSLLTASNLFSLISINHALSAFLSGMETLGQNGRGRLRAGDRRALRKGDDADYWKAFADSCTHTEAKCWHDGLDLSYSGSPPGCLEVLKVVGEMRPHVRVSFLPYHYVRMLCGGTKVGGVKAVQLSSPVAHRSSSELLPTRPPSVLHRLASIRKIR